MQNGLRNWKGLPLNTREPLIRAFLETSGWKNATRAALASDASNRRYERLTDDDGQRAVLMDAQPEAGENIQPFLKIARFLRSNGMSAPDIYAVDEANGLLLLEDLGDDLFARVVLADTTQEAPLYGAAVDALLALHDMPPPEGLQKYSVEMLSKFTGITWQWYPGSFEKDWQEKARAFQASFETILAQTDGVTEVLIQRDFHAENLIWLPDRNGIAQVGMLDFQDALIGHRSYDLVSLLQDARRDVPVDLEAQMIDRYLQKSGLSRADFLAAYHLMGLQRNLRILGIFARLCLHFGKAHYVDFIPRVWSYVERDLAHPAAAPIREQVLRDLPAPTPDHLQRLRDLCGTVPTP